MGNTLATMQTDLTGTDSREILDRLEDMAQDRIDLFYDKIGYASSRYYDPLHWPDL